MARFQLTQALTVGHTRLKAGRTIADSTGNALPGDFVWTGLSAATVTGGSPLHAAERRRRNGPRCARRHSPRPRPRWP
jgi:hypothetical protein